VRYSEIQRDTADIVGYSEIQARYSGYSGDTVIQWDTVDMLQNG